MTCGLVQWLSVSFQNPGGPHLKSFSSGSCVWNSAQDFLAPSPVSPRYGFTDAGQNSVSEVGYVAARTSCFSMPLKVFCAIPSCFFPLQGSFYNFGIPTSKDLISLLVVGKHAAHVQGHHVVSRGPSLASRRASGSSV